MMFQHKLQEIDQQLIHLIGKRIEVLGELEHICLEEQFANVTLSLAQADVPESIWKNILTGCAAAVGTASSLPAKVEPRRVTLIGGSGLMGRFFNSRLSAAGHHVSILARSDWEQAESLLKGADLVLVCVPIESTIEVIGKIAKYLGPQTALADIASIKAPILQAMLEHHSGPVMGLHPMFGPGVQSFLSQNVVVCSGRQDEAFQWLLDLISNEGGKLIVSGAEEHDEIMVAIQAIRNFATFSLGTFLAQEELDIRRSLDFSSPVFRMEIGFISRLFAQSAPLIVDIMLATPERQQAICRLANTYNRLAQLVMQGDRDTLIHEFKTAHSCLAEEINSTLEESSHVINALSTLLAARDVEQKHSAFASPQNSAVSSTKDISKTGMFSLL